MGILCDGEAVGDGVIGAGNRDGSARNAEMVGMAEGTVERKVEDGRMGTGVRGGGGGSCCGGDVRVCAVGDREKSGFVVAGYMKV